MQTWRHEPDLAGDGGGPVRRLDACLVDALAKSSTDKACDTALIHLLGSVVAIAHVAAANWPDRAAWPLIVTSLVIHIACYTEMTGAYEHSDLGLTCPPMRGTAPLLRPYAPASTKAYPFQPPPLSPGCRIDIARCWRNAPRSIQVR